MDEDRDQHRGEQMYGGSPKHMLPWWVEAPKDVNGMRMHPHDDWTYAEDCILWDGHKDIRQGMF